MASHEDEDDEKQPEEVVPSQNDFLCRISTNFNIFSQLLETLNWNKDQKAGVTITESGLKFVVDFDKCLEAKVYLTTDLFDHYEMGDQKCISLGVDLNLILQCLTIFGDSCHLEITYSQETAAWKMVLEDNGIVTSVDLYTINPEENTDLDFNKAALCTTLTLDPEYLKEVFSELEVFGTADSLVAVKVSAEEGLRIEVSDDLGLFEATFPFNETKIFKDRQHEKDCCFDYRLNLIRPACRGVNKATDTIIQVNELGLIRIIHAIESNRIEFVVQPLEEWDFH